MKLENKNFFACFWQQKKRLKKMIEKNDIIEEKKDYKAWEVVSKEANKIEAKNKKLKKENQRLFTVIQKIVELCWKVETIKLKEKKEAGK